MMAPEERDAEFRAIYEAVPDPHCKGLCGKSCTIIPMTVHEARVLRRNGTPLPNADVALMQAYGTGDIPTCPALVDDRCTVYAIRPLVCRLYGAVEDMQCQHGCVPDEGFLTVAESHVLIDRARVAGGGDR